MWGASLVLNLLVGSPQPGARQACSIHAPLLCASLASLGLSGPQQASQAPSQPASQPANSASQPASQLPGRNSACGYIGALVVILLVGMLLEWSWNVLFCIVLYCSVLFWSWNGPVLVLEWSGNAPGIVLEWSWNGPGMYCSVLFCTVLYCSVLFWSWNPGRKSACGEPPWS